MKKNRRIQGAALLILAAVLLAFIALLGSFWQEAAITTDFTRKKYSSVYTISFWDGLDGP